MVVQLTLPWSSTDPALMCLLHEACGPKAVSWLASSAPACNACIACSPSATSTLLPTLFTTIRTGTSVLVLFNCSRLFSGREHQHHDILLVSWHHFGFCTSVLFSRPQPTQKTHVFLPLCNWQLGCSLLWLQHLGTPQLPLAGDVAPYRHHSSGGTSVTGKLQKQTHQAKLSSFFPHAHNESRKPIF